MLSAECPSQDTSAALHGKAFEGKHRSELPFRKRCVAGYNARFRLALDRLASSPTRAVESQSASVRVWDRQHRLVIAFNRTI